MAHQRTASQEPPGAPPGRGVDLLAQRPVMAALHRHLRSPGSGSAAVPALQNARHAKRACSCRAGWQFYTMPDGVNKPAWPSNQLVAAGMTNMIVFQRPTYISSQLGLDPDHRWGRHAVRVSSNDRDHFLCRRRCGLHGDATAGRCGCWCRLRGDDEARGDRPEDRFLQLGRRARLARQGARRDQCFLQRTTQLCSSHTSSGPEAISEILASAKPRRISSQRAVRFNQRALDDAWPTRSVRADPAVLKRRAWILVLDHKSRCTAVHAGCM